MVHTLKHYRALLTALWLPALFAAFLSGCGGGGGSPGVTGIGTGTGAGTGTGTSGSVATGTIVIALTDSTGVASNSVSGANSLVAKATVRDAKGTPVQNAVVTFALSNDIAVLSPSSGTALTDASGVAQIGVKSANKTAGAAEITASATVGGGSVTAKAAFAVGAAATATPAAINFVSAVPSDKSIVIKGSGGNGRTEVALLTFSIVDSSNAGVPNAKVNFTTQSSAPVTLISTSATSDASGNVTVAVNSGTQPTTLRVIATVEGTSINAISDTVTVTTGQPVQASFSLSVEKFYVEGANFDNIPNKITALLADSFGGAVADGTQIVFTTDGGAIVGDGGAKCLTVQGACSVTWRSQNPRTSSGVVTVMATATNSNTNLSSSINFYASGSFPRAPVVTPDNTVLTAGGAANTFNFQSCSPGTLTLMVADAQNNPMPVDTTLSATNVTNVTANITPSKVSWNGNPIVGGSGGTLHTLTVTPPTTCTTSGGTAKTGSVTVVIKSPLGSDTPFTYTFNYSGT